MSGYVYAIGDGNGHVKIGWSNNPMRRLVKVKCDCCGDIQLLGIMEGSRSDEAATHARLSAHRLNGEWFDLTAAPVAAFVSGLMSAEPRRPRTFGAGKSHPIAEYRAAHGLSLGALAARLGLHKTVLGRYENGERFPTVEITARIAEATGIPPKKLRPDLARIFGVA